MGTQHKTRRGKTMMISKNKLRYKPKENSHLGIGTLITLSKLTGIPRKNLGIPKIGDKKVPIKPDSILHL